MKETKDVTACVVDHGLFVPVARRLARSFKKVYYFTPWEKSFPTVWDLIGDGFEDIRRINDPWEVKESCDLYVFPDIGFAPLQRQLLEQGYPVWGARGGDILEISRGKFLQALEEETNLPVPTFHKIVGL